MTTRMILSSFMLALAAQAAPAPAADLTAEQSASLRCSAAFAIVAEGQAIGNAQALEYPPLADRGREFFVRSTARLMDEAQLDREQVQALLSAEAQRLWDEQGAIERVMPACMLMLEAAGL